VLTSLASRSRSLSDQLNRRQPLQVAFSQDSPAIPALPETLLRLDLLVQQRCINLRDVTDLVLADVGATLQVLRSAGREFSSPAERPARIADCICHLGIAECERAISSQTVPEDGWQPAMLEFWAHCGSTAQYCKLIAENMSGINPDEAYLVGLLHALGSLPELLGWSGPGAVCGSLAGLRLAIRWPLPDPVVEYFNDLHQETYTTRWLGVVRSAHGARSTTPPSCPVRANHHRAAVGASMFDRVPGQDSSFGLCSYEKASGRSGPAHV
jgi:HD-like signal output (HDOD) protein